MLETLLLDSAPAAAAIGWCFWCSVLVATVFDDLVDDDDVDVVFDIPGAEEDDLSEVADLVVVVGAESDDAEELAFAFEGTNGIEAGFNVDLIGVALVVVVVVVDDVVDVRFGIGISWKILFVLLFILQKYIGTKRTQLILP